MKTMLITAAATILIFGTAFARDIYVNPGAIPHSANIIVGRRVAQSTSIDRASGVPCTTKSITTIMGDGSKSTRKSVDCEE
jgi:hypothetical protein